MVKFTFSGQVNADGSWTFSAEAADGQDATCSDVARVLSLALIHFTANPNASIRPPVELPEGWSATNDGVNLLLTDGVPSHTRRYIKDGADETTWEAPCNADGSPNAATLAALVG